MVPGQRCWTVRLVRCFFFRFFLSGEGKEKPSEGTREVAVFLLFLLFSTFLGGGFYSIFLCRNFCKIYHIRLIG